MKGLLHVLIACLLSFSAGATSYYSGATGNLDDLNSWWANSNGTGAHPPSFTAASQVLTIMNNATPTIGANWVVSGAGSKVVAGDGTNACNFTIPAAFSFTGTIDVAANATLTITNAQVPVLGVRNITSTVNYNAPAGGQIIAAGVYGNLMAGNVSGTQTAAGIITVNGALSTTSGSTLNMSSFQLAGVPTSVTNDGAITTMSLANPAIPSGKIWGGAGLVNFAAVSGAQFIPAGTYGDLTFNNISGTNTAVGTLTINGALTITAGGTLAMGAFQMGGTPAAVINNGTITTSSTANPALPPGLTWSGTNGQVTFAATTGGQFIPAGAFGKLTLSNTSGTNTAGGDITVTTALTTTSGGTMDMAAFQLLGSITTLTNNGTIATSCMVDPAIPTGRNWSGTTGLIVFATPGGGQSIPAGIYKGLALSNTSGTNTAIGILTVNGGLTTTTGGTLDMGSFQLLGTLTSVTNNGAITTSGTANPALPSGKNWSGTTGLITFAAAAGGQFIPAGTYKNLTLSNTTGSNAAAGALAINGILTTTSGDTLAMGIYQLLGAPVSVVNDGTITTLCTVNPAIPTGKTWSGATGQLIFAAATGGQFIPAGTFGGLILNNTSGSNTAAGILTINGSLTTTSGGTLAMGVFQMLGSPVAVTNNGTITTASTANPALPADQTWSGTTGLVTFTAATGGQFIPPGTYGTLALNNGSGISAAAGTLIINGALTTRSGGTLAMGGFQMLGTLSSVINNGTITTLSTANPALPAGLAWTGTTGQVTFAGTSGGQFIPSGTFGKLTAGNTSGTVTATGALTVNAALTTTAGGTLDMAAFPLLGAITTLTNNGTISTTATMNPAIPAGKNWTGTNGIVIFAAPSGGQFVSAGTYKTLTLGNTTGTNTAAGALTVSAGLTTTTGGALDMGSFQLLGTITAPVNNGTIVTTCTVNPAIPAGKNWTGTTGSVIFAAATGGQSIPAGTYKGLVVSNTAGTNTAVGALTVNGTLTTTSGGTLAMAAFQLLGAPSAVFNNGTITTICTANPAIPASVNWTSDGTSLINFSSASGGQFIPDGIYKTLTCSNTSGTNLAVGTLSVTGTITTSATGGTLDMGTNALIAATIVNTGTLKTQNTSAAPLPTGRTWSGMVNYNGTGNQTIVAGSYTSLTLAGARVATPTIALEAGSINLSGSFTVSYTGDVAFSGAGNAFTYSGNTAQTVGGIAYNDLVLANTGLTKTAGGNISVDGTLTTTSGGTLAMSSFQLAGPGATIVNNGTVTTNCILNPALPTGKNWVGTTGLVTFAAATGGQYIPAGTYKALTCSNTSDTNTVTGGNLVVTGTIITSGAGGTLDMGTNALAAAILTNNANGTLLTQCTAGTPLPSGLSYAGTVNYYAPAGGQTIVAGTYSKLTVSNTSGTSTASGNLIVNNALTTASGGTLNMGANTLTGSALTPTGAGTIKTANTSVAPIKSGITWPQTIEYNALAGGQTIVTGIYNGGLTNSNTSGINTVAAAGTVRISAVLTLNAGSVLSDNNQTITVSGNIAGTGTHTTTAGKINMTGGGQISGTTIGNLTLNNAGGFTLTGNPTINGTLTLTAGQLALGDNNLTLGASAPAVAGGPSSAKMIVINGSGALRKQFTANGSYLFPVGDAESDYTPATLNFTGGTYGAGAYAAMRVTHDKHPNDASPTNYLNRYWSVSMAGITSPAYAVTNATYVLSDVIGEETGIVSAQFTGTLPWIKYSAVNSGTHAVSTTTVTNTTSDFGGITATNSTVDLLPESPVVCSGSSVAITATGSGAPPFTYTWSPAAHLSATTGASVTATLTTGTDVALYTYTVTATDGNGFVSTATTQLTVNPIPRVITGDSVLCSGSAGHLSDADVTGTWMSNNTSVATIGVSDGVLTGISAGTTTITYVFSNGCGRTKPVTINALPSVAAITGTGEVCVAASAVLGDVTASGEWSSDAVSVATIDAGGLVAGMSQGNATISYAVTNEFGCSARATHGITVNPLPVAGSLTGTSSICAGFVTGLSASVTGGLWLSSDTSIAEVDSVGNVKAKLGGSSTDIRYVMSNGCGSDTAAFNFTVKALPGIGTISSPGNHQVCLGAQDLYSATNAGGIWSLGDTTIATISGIGLVTGIMPGTTTISYTITGENGCSKTRLSGITVNSLPVVPTIGTGAGTVCQGSMITLTEDVGPGTIIWGSDDTAVAVINLWGVVTGKSAGTATISFSYTHICTSYAETIVTVVAATAASITGAAAVCAGGATTTLTGLPSGGTWASGNVAKATVDGAGIVTGLSSGTSRITYSYINGAGCTSTAVVTVTVNGIPVVAATSGPGSVCSGSSVTLVNTTGGGAWSSSDTAVGLINASGVFTGIAAGSALASYTVTGMGGCAKTDIKMITVNALPEVAGIQVGAGMVCLGGNLTLTDTTVGTHLWISANTAVATINPGTGVVTGVGAGTAVISYRYTQTCSNYAQATITVNPVTTVSVSGTPAVCAGGGTTTLTGSPVGGTWTSSAPTRALADVSGLVTGGSAGGATITYAYINGYGCISRATMAITVNPQPSVAAIVGSNSVCAGSEATFTDATTGGLWFSSNTAMCSINASGVVTGITAGTVNISYTVSGLYGCTKTATKITSVNAAPSVSEIVGAGAVCRGSTLTLTDATSGTHLWSSANAAVATINAATGVLTGVGGGTVVVSYRYTAGCSNYATAVVTVNTPVYVEAVSGLSTVAQGATITLTDATSGGVWSSSEAGRVSLDPSGSTLVVTGMLAGTTVISYAVGDCGESWAVKTITVTAAKPGGSAQHNTTASELLVYPNPTSGTFTVKCGAGTLVIYSLEGKEIAQYVMDSGTNQLNLADGLAGGIYVCSFTGNDGSTGIVRLVYQP